MGLLRKKDGSISILRIICVSIAMSMAIKFIVKKIGGIFNCPLSVEEEEVPEE